MARREMGSKRREQEENQEEEGGEGGEWRGKDVTLIDVDGLHWGYSG